MAPVYIPAGNSARPKAKGFEQRAVSSGSLDDLKVNQRMSHITTLGSELNANQSLTEGSGCKKGNYYCNTVYSLGFAASQKLGKQHVIQSQ